MSWTSREKKTNTVVCVGLCSPKTVSNIAGYGRTSTSLKVFCSEQSSSRGGIEIAQLFADWLIRLPIRTCVKPPITSDYSLAPKLLFVDYLKILANEKQAVQFRSPILLVCEQKRCSHMLRA